MTSSDSLYLTRRLEKRFKDASPGYVADRRAETALLDAHGVSSRDDLVRLAEDSGTDTHVRALACWYLARLWPASQSRSEISALLKDQAAEVRIEAARALGVMRVRSIVSALGDLALHDGDVHVREAALQALAMVGGKDAANLLLQVLLSEHEPPKLRAAAAEQLGHAGTRIRSVIAGLLATLDEQPDIAIESIRALGLLGARAAVPELRRLSQTDNRASRRRELLGAEAERALESIEAQRWD